MNKIFKIALGMAGMLLLTTLPAYCTTIALNIGTNGTYSGTSGSFDVTTLIETETVAGGGTYSQTITLPLADALILSFTAPATGASSLSLETDTAVASPFKNYIAASTTFYNAGTNLSLTGTMTSGVLAETVATTNPAQNAVTAAAFAQALGLASGATFTISGGITGSSGVVRSDTLALTTSDTFATPEPSTTFLLGTGLLAVAAFARKRKLGTV